jgi:hypothetical protein
VNKGKYCIRKRGTFDCYAALKKNKLFEGRTASVTPADDILNSQKTQFVSIRTADPFILLMKIAATYAQNPSTRCRKIELLIVTWEAFRVTTRLSTTEKRMHEFDEVTQNKSPALKTVQFESHKQKILMDNSRTPELFQPQAYLGRGKVKQVPPSPVFFCLRTAFFWLLS